MISGGGPHRHHSLLKRREHKPPIHVTGRSLPRVRSVRDLERGAGNWIAAIAPDRARQLPSQQAWRNRQGRISTTGTGDREHREKDHPGARPLEVHGLFTWDSVLAIGLHTRLHLETYRQFFYRAPPTALKPAVRYLLRSESDYPVPTNNIVRANQVSCSSVGWGGVTSSSGVRQ
jgi:hypothetical protein